MTDRREFPRLFSSVGLKCRSPPDNLPYSDTSLIEFSNCIDVARSAHLRESGCWCRRAGRRRRPRIAPRHPTDWPRHRQVRQPPICPRPDPLPSAAICIATVSSARATVATARDGSVRVRRACGCPRLMAWHALEPRARSKRPHLTMHPPKARHSPQPCCTLSGRRMRSAMPGPKADQYVLKAARLVRCAPRPDSRASAACRPGLRQH